MLTQSPGLVNNDSSISSVQVICWQSTRWINSAKVIYTSFNKKNNMLIEKLKVFFNWWGSGLYRGLPGPLRRLFRSEQPRLSLQVTEDDRVSVSWRADGKQKDGGEYRLNRDQFDYQRIVAKCAHRKKHLLELVLDPTQTLHLQHAFPDAARDNIGQVVSYQLDRLTPFTADNAYFNARVARYDKVKKEVAADIYVTPKAVVDNLFARLQALGVPNFDVVSALDGRIKLRNGRENNALAADKRCKWSKAPLYFFVGALIASLVVPIVYKQRRIDQINDAISEMRLDAAEQLEIRDKLMAAGDALLFLEKRRRTSPVALDVVERLSTEIPKHAWLERLELAGREILIRGESNRALSLIDTLEESPHFSRVSFNSPVTRSKNNGKDKFHIQASVELNHE